MDRRSFLSGTFTLAALSPAGAGEFVAPLLRGSIDANQNGLVAGADGDQGRTLQRLLNDAAAVDKPLFIPPGRYVIANVVLPARARMVGIAGASRLVFAGDGHFISAEGAALIELSGLVLDGDGKALADYVPGLVHIVGSPNVTISACEIVGSGKSGLALDRCAGRISGCRISRAADAGIRTIESAGMAITDNVVEDCDNGGILIHRWTEGADGTLVTANRVERIGATNGGTGEFGNGINIFRAHGVTVANNRIADCAFTAVRANSANNISITGNNCARCGETGIYSEFSFAGALIANNIIDGAATGIGVSNFQEGGRIAVVSGNIIRDLTGKGPYSNDSSTFGIGIAVEADASVTGNVIDGAPRAGMMLGWGPYLRDVAATGNVIRRAPIGIAISVADGAGSAVVNNNMISGADQGAIVGMRWGDQASGDLARSGAEAFPNLMIERNAIS
ncbi:MAG: TIGR03808 family TAT-translocated repetitive protein [Bauldia sp.]